MVTTCNRILMTACAVFLLCLFFAAASISAGDHIGWQVSIVAMCITGIAAVVKMAAHA